MREKIEMIVRKVVQEYFTKNESEEKSKQIIILLENQVNQNQTAIWDLVQLISKHYNTTILYSEAWANIPDEMKCTEFIPLHKDNIEVIYKEMEKADLLFLPIATYSMLSKLALTIDDSLGMWITIQMQLNGKKLLVADDQVTLRGAQKVTAPFSVVRRIQSYFKHVREDKVQLVPLSGALKWLESYFDSFTQNRYVVLSKHIEEVARLGETELIVPKNSLITPMCKDYAKELGISIKQRES